jgi:hypothetical protein
LSALERLAGAIASSEPTSDTVRETVETPLIDTVGA